jgi:hypothetical protein
VFVAVARWDQRRAQGEESVMGTRWISRLASAMVAVVGTRVLRLRSRRPSHGTVVAYAALFVALGGTALATTQGFVLGTTNRVDAASKVTNVKADSTQNTIASPLLTLENLTTGTGATALRLNVASGHQPFTVNSSTQVPNLNASLLGGKSASAFLLVNGTAANAAKLGGIAPSGYVKGTGTVSGTPGYFNVDSGGEVYLGPVGNLGGLWGHCEDPKFPNEARVQLSLANSIPAGGALVAAQMGEALEALNSGSASFTDVLALGGGQSYNTVGTGHPPSGKSLGEFSTLQISYGNEMDTITATIWDYNDGSNDHCDFATQVVSRTG